MRSFAIIVLLCAGFGTLSAQTTYTGIFRTATDNTTYHQFVRDGGGAAVYINQVGSGHPILRLSRGSATANVNVVLTVENDGRVGIGTINPQAKLAVDGNILAKEVKVKTDISVPDYVFEDDYKLPALAEVEAYVKEHRRLPEIPSAKNIARDGLDLAEMNLLLLKKVEELTLHLIEKNKVQKRHENLIEQQKHQLQKHDRLIMQLEKSVSDLLEMDDKRN